jgi:mRNA interferase RelE/StbE
MYEVLVEASAAKGLRRLPKEDLARIARELRGLTGDARPAGSRKIAGSADAYRIRVGDYRIVYQVDDGQRRVVVQAIGHRKDVYRPR